MKDSEFKPLANSSTPATPDQILKAEKTFELRGEEAMLNPGKRDAIVHQMHDDLNAMTPKARLAFFQGYDSAQQDVSLDQTMSVGGGGLGATRQMFTPGGSLEKDSKGNVSGIEFTGSSVRRLLAEIPLVRNLISKEPDDTPIDFKIKPLNIKQ